ncbi:YciE/YciF ferroxidase family protein [Serratia fonticola]|uniref:YciE/YciF ferroxidase family protein n=1 Tax=Serratia fonticola TaxID=47917 RepID=UPI0021AD7443|nr:ferritin-like domain-containing protein [Serratia fonticola]
MLIKSLNDLFIHALSDVYSAEKQLIKALPKLARAAEQEDLVNAFKNHLEETQGQIERLDKLVESTPEVRIKRIKCLAMEGLIEEGQEIIDGVAAGSVRDAGLIAAAQKVEHYEIATYGTLCALAEKLGYTTAKNLLGETLEEEKETDKKLTLIAEKKVNKQVA